MGSKLLFFTFYRPKITLWTALSLTHSLKKDNYNDKHKDKDKETRQEATLDINSCDVYFAMQFCELVKQVKAR